AVDGEVEEIAADAAIIEERVAFARRAVAGDRLAPALGVDEEVEKAALRRLDALGERGIGRKLAQAGLLLALRHGADAGRRRPAGILGVADKEPQRAAMRPQFLDIEDAQTVSGQQRLDRGQREIPEMLVIDGVELVLVDKAQEM